MRQGANSRSHLHSLTSSARGNCYTPTDQDRIKQLQDSSKKGLCKVRMKRALLVRVIQLKKELLELAKDNTTDCHEQLDKLIWDSLTSKHCINKSSNVDLSFSIVSLFDIFIVLEERLKSRQRRTRQGASKPSETQQLLNEFIELKKKVDDQIVEAFRQLGGRAIPFSRVLPSLLSNYHSSSMPIAYLLTKHISYVFSVIITASTL